jgi:glycosyltransferase involved in cell wall biosynthesis
VFRGTLSSAELRQEFREAHALLLLSSIEGFGLPALESWFVGTPVCYSREGSLPEVLDGVPGGCDVADEVSFRLALTEILELPGDERDRHGEKLRVRFGAERFGSDIVKLFRRWLRR